MWVAVIIILPSSYQIYLQFSLYAPKHLHDRFPSGERAVWLPSIAWSHQSCRGVLSVTEHLLGMFKSPGWVLSGENLDYRTRKADCLTFWRAVVGWAPCMLCLPPCTTSCRPCWSRCSQNIPLVRISNKEGVACCLLLALLLASSGWLMLETEFCVAWTIRQFISSCLITIQLEMLKTHTHRRVLSLRPFQELLGKVQIWAWKGNISERRHLAAVHPVHPAGAGMMRMCNFNFLVECWLAGWLTDWLTGLQLSLPKGKCLWD